MIKTCDNCGKQFQAMSNKAKFCCPNCRLIYFRKRQANEIIVPKKEQTKDLTGLPTATTVTKELIPVTEQLNPVYEFHLDLYNDYVARLNIFYNKREKAIEKYHQILSKDFGLDTALITGILGGIIGYAITPAYVTQTVTKEITDEDGETQIIEVRENVPNPNRLAGAGIGLGLFALGGYIWATVSGDEKINRLLDEMKREIADINQRIENFEGWRKFEGIVLDKVPKFIPLTQQQYEKVNEPLRTTMPVFAPKSPIEGLSVIKDTEPKSEPPKVLSAHDLAQKTFIVIPFEEPYRSLIGEPPFGFHAIIYGEPGQGKSTFAMEFANYLASKHGRVLYISGEEGHEKTLVDKINRIKADNVLSTVFDVADVSNAQDAIELIKNSHYPFVFIDSASYLKLKADSIKEIKSFSKSSLIVIHQSTKSGEMKGAQELQHDADVVICVSEFKASTKGEKNRYGAHNTIAINELNKA